MYYLAHQPGGLTDDDFLSDQILHLELEIGFK